MGRPAIDWTGKRVYFLTVICRIGSSSDGHAQWLCLCDCGNYCKTDSNQLKNGRKKSCGCWRKENAAIQARGRYDNLTNQHFHKLIAKEYIGSGPGGPLWRCECDCGNKNFVTTAHHLTSGNTQSCGCLKSKGEENIVQILQQNNIIFIQQHVFTNLKYESGIPVRFDFYLPDYNRLIEFDGKQHFEPTGGWATKENFIRNQKNDKIRNKYTLEHNIPLVRIPYWERDNITLEMIMGDKYLVKE